MTYSCAYFQGKDESLEAQTAKYDRLCKKLKLGENDHVLEIGCGWGGLPNMRLLRLQNHRNYNFRGTIKVCERPDHKSRFRRKGDFAVKDYRHVEGQFDKIVSIEMLKPWETLSLNYFEQCNRLLKPKDFWVCK